ncbi:MAG: hypothetical protein K1X39_09305 [Thermoflexales bacterium]|nr:hypothetical protein [Thermoflexales bacterium]
MSKTNRRYRTPNLPASAYSAPAAAAQPAPVSAKAPSAAAAARALPVLNKTAWQDEYSDVMGDLKRTGVIAGVLLLAMVALSFFLR